MLKVMEKIVLALLILIAEPDQVPLENALANTQKIVPGARSTLVLMVQLSGFVNAKRLRAVQCALLRPYAPYELMCESSVRA